MNTRVPLVYYQEEIKITVKRLWRYWAKLHETIIYTL